MSAVKQGKMPAKLDALGEPFGRFAAQETHVGRAKVAGGTVVRHVLARVIGLTGLATMAVGAVLSGIAQLWH